MGPGGRAGYSAPCRLERGRAVGNIGAAGTTPAGPAAGREPHSHMAPP